MLGFKNFQDKVAVVTGGASGIGRGIAEELLSRGARVVIADIEQTPLDKTAAEIGAVGIQADVSSLASMEALRKRVVDQFGAVHILCNNAGISPIAPIADMTIGDWQWIMNVNFWGVVHGVDQFLPILKANADGGHVLNTASMGGLFVAPMVGAYCTSKYAVVGLTEALAQELQMAGSPVGATAFCPGTVQSNLATGSRNRPTALGGGNLRDGSPEDTGGPIGDIKPTLPREAGRIAVDAIVRGDLYATTNREFFRFIQDRFGAIEAALSPEAA